MKKKTLMCIPVALILSMAIITMGSASTQTTQTTPTVSVSPQTTERQIGIGDTLTINVTVDYVDMSFKGDGFSMALDWDPNVLDLTSEANTVIGDLFANKTVMQIGPDIIPGEVFWSVMGTWDDGTGPVGGGTLFTCNLTVVGYGYTDLNITAPSIISRTIEVIPIVVNGMANLTSTFTTTIIVNSVSYPVEIDSNSTITNFNCDNSTRKINFNVTSPDTTFRYCNITLPNAVVQDLWQNNYTVIVDGQPRTTNNWTDGTNTYLSFTNVQSIHEIVIVPEFAWALILPLLAGITLVAAVLRKNAWSKKPRGPVVAG
jgi:hypothetical protein